MKIAVINGSPKGKNSLTREYVRYLQKYHPQHIYEEFPVALEVGKLEKERELFRKNMAEIKDADAIIWSFPVYYMLVPSQYKRWLEMIGEEGCEEAFAGKPCIVITTSIHFYDDTAHNYLRALCDDLKMRYIGGYSAEMYDLLKSKERQRFLAFADIFFDALAQGYALKPAFEPLLPTSIAYIPQTPAAQIDLRGKRALIIAERSDKNDNLTKMITRVKETLLGQVDIFYLEDIDIKGGCIGCCACGLDNKCSYRDGYMDFYNNNIKNASVLIFACHVRDRFLSAKWKQFIDRSFFNGHTPSLQDKQIGFLLSGAFQQTANIRTILNAYIGIQKANLIDIISDEADESAAIDTHLDDFCALLAKNLEHGYIAPPNFLAIGGYKIFRDDIYGKLRFVFQADHRYYKKRGFYDFPQKNYKIRLRNSLMVMLTKIPSFRRQFSKLIVPQMKAPLFHIVKNK